VFDSGTADGRAYTVMELCAGRPAQRFCDDATRLRLAEVLMVGIQVAETMQAVHAMGVIHRDLSAQNILIEAGREPRVKVIDFTGCLLTDRFFSLRDEPRPADALEVDRPLHMLPFAAPEVRAEQRWSEGSDIYALGVLLYRLLTGKMPYTTQARDQYIPLSRSSHSRSVDHVLAAMLNPDPVQRLADMAMVAERLRDALEEETAGDEQPAARPQLTLVAAPMDDTAPPAADEEACPIAADAGLAPTSPQPSPTVANEGPASPERLAVGSPSASPLPSATMQRSWRIPLLLGGFGALAVLLGVLAWSWYPRPTTKPEPAARLVSTATRPPFEPAHAVDVAPGLSTPENSPAPLDQPKPADDKAATVIAPSVPRPRLNQATVHRLLASRVKTCSDKWLTLKLRVVGGVGHVETINGFLPQPGLQGAQRCVTDAIASTRFPSTTSATFTLRFAPTR
jgi:serine/threonine protein kinase